MEYSLDIPNIPSTDLTKIMQALNSLQSLSKPLQARIISVQSQMIQGERTVSIPVRYADEVTYDG